MSAVSVLQVSHTVTLSTLAESGYRFGATYVGTQQTGPAEVNSHLSGLEIISQPLYPNIIIF